MTKDKNTAYTGLNAGICGIFLLGGFRMKIVVVKSPKMLCGLLLKLFRMR